MTISSDTSFEFDIASIFVMAYREAGVINPNQGITPAQSNAARDELSRIVMGSQAKGLFAKVVKFESVTLISGQSTYTMPGEVLDVVGTAMFVPLVGSLAGESQVQIMQRDEYQTITNKDTTARPSRYFPSRVNEGISCILWPIPGAAEDGATVRFQTHRIRANVRDTTATIDYEQYWVDAMTTDLAYRLAKANAMPIAERETLRRDAKEKYDECRPMAMQRGPQQFVVAHRTSWSSR